MTALKAPCRHRKVSGVFEFGSDTPGHDTACGAASVNVVNGRTKTGNGTGRFSSPNIKSPYNDLIIAVAVAKPVNFYGYMKRP